MRHLAIDTATGDLAEATDEALVSDSTTYVATYLLALRDLKQNLTGHMADVEARLVELMGKERRLEIPGVGLFQWHKKVKRNQWDHEELIRDVLRHGWEGGDPPEAAYAAAELIRKHLSLSGGKVTALRDLGLQVDEYCHEELDGRSVELPSRDHEEDAA